MKSIEMPPSAPALMESTRAIGYTTEAAVADVIDNSIAADAETVSLWYSPAPEPYVAILDDGIGMKDSELSLAMQYGSTAPTQKRSEKDLGRYGLGMKTASLSQCRRLVVVSKQGGKISGRQWDLDEVLASGTWTLQVLEEDDLALVPEIGRLYKQEQGTLVVWEKLDKMLVGEQDVFSALTQRMTAVRQHLALVFHRYLAGEPGLKSLKIAMNAVDVEPRDPFLATKSSRPMDDGILRIRNAKVRIRPYLLPHINRMTKDEYEEVEGKEGLRRTQGFYVYRNCRLVVWGTWFRLRAQDELTKLARIQIDIPNDLDDLWSLDVKKSSATPPKEVRDQLASIVNRTTERGERVFKVRGRRPRSKEVYVWDRIIQDDGSLRFEVNRRHPAVQRVLGRGDETDKELHCLFTVLEKGLPLDQLKIDLNSDRKIQNAEKWDAAQIRAEIDRVMSDISEDLQQVYLDSLRITEPYKSFPEIIDEFLAEKDT